MEAAVCALLVTMVDDVDASRFLGTDSFAVESGGVLGFGATRMIVCFFDLSAVVTEVCCLGGCDVDGAEELLPNCTPTAVLALRSFLNKAKVK